MLYNRFGQVTCLFPKSKIYNMKTSGWIIATAVKVLYNQIEFRVDESESFKNSIKFPDLLKKTILFPQKDKFWKSEICKGRKHMVTFNRTAEEVVFREELEYVLLISRNDLAIIRLVGTAMKEDLYKLLGRNYKSIGTTLYLVNIPLIKGSVRGSINEIYLKLRRLCRGDPNVYLTHEKSEWYILAPDGELKETSTPMLPQNVR